MTTFEALSLIVQTSICLPTGLTFIVTIVVLLKKEVTALRPRLRLLLRKYIQQMVNRTLYGL